LIRVLLAVVILAVMAGCSENSEETLDSSEQPQVSPFSNKNTYVGHSENRYFEGVGGLPSGLTRYEFTRPEDGIKWIVAADSSSEGTIWGFVREDGTSSRFHLIDREISKVGSTSPLENHSFLPQIVEVESDGIELAINAVINPVDLTLAAALSKIENVPDASSVIQNSGLLYSYSDPTERYPHGALGDNIEWGSLVIGSIDPAISEHRFSLPENEVFEGLFPLLADLNGDGLDEIVTTVSDSDNGSRVVVFSYVDDELRIIAESAPVGTGFRWLHQIAVAPFGSDGEIELAVVETPHVGGIAKFYRLDNGRMELVASNAGGYMSHVNGSRNLDQAVAGDFDGDGNVELLVPSRDQESLIALRRVGDSVEEVWQVELGARLSSNLTVTQTTDSGLILGAAIEGAKLNIWQ